MYLSAFWFLRHLILFCVEVPKLSWQVLNPLLRDCIVRNIDSNHVLTLEKNLTSSLPRSFYNPFLPQCGSVWCRCGQNTFL